MEHFDSEIIQIVKATGEIYGRTVSDAAATMFLVDLAGFNPDEIKKALSKCRKEIKTFPSVADVIARIDDGRPGVEAAWAMIPKDEDGSTVWSEEMAEAFGACRGLLETDQIAARMTFKEVYSRLVSESRAAGKQVFWSPSFGHEITGREAAVRDAIDKKRIGISQAQKLLPQLDFTENTSLLPGRAGSLGINLSKLLHKMPGINMIDPPPGEV